MVPLLTNAPVSPLDLFDQRARGFEFLRSAQMSGPRTQRPLAQLSGDVFRMRTCDRLEV